MTYPVFLKLDGKRCVVVGAGAVAERKVASLLKAGARVKVVGSGATDGIKELGHVGRIEWLDRDFEPNDLDGAFLVIAATDDVAVNEAAHAGAKAGGALVNVVDRPALCDFFVPAVVERGQLQVAVSTGGESPALARRLKERFETELGPEYADYLRVVGDYRRRVRSKVGDVEKRRQAYERLFASDLLEKIKQGSKVDIDELVNRFAV